MNQTNRTPTKILFIGNSATYVNDIPHMLEVLATKAGYILSADSVTEDGYTLIQHTQNKQLFKKIAEVGYDVIFLQEHSQALYDEKMNNDTHLAHTILNDAIKKSGAKTYLYMRPATKKDIFGCDTITQSIKIDEGFGGIADKIGACKAYVNRAVAYAFKNYGLNLWREDDAHLNEYGGYLAVCVFFTTLFSTSATALSSGTLPERDALILKQIADRIVLEELIPW